MTDRTDPVSTAARRPDGKFGPGNPGRPRGARGRATQAALALLDRDVKGITRKCVELALAGDVTAIRLILERLIPVARERPMPAVTLPEVSTAADVPAAISAIAAAVAAGDVLPSEGAALTKMFSEMARTAELAEFDARLKKLEESANA